jgi:DNA-binding transcriptional regulator/RsmH inhibitor MraZ
MPASKRPSGVQTARLDERLRVAVPARMLEAFRAVAEDLAGQPLGDTLDVVVGIDENLNLAVFPKAAHERLVEMIEAKPRSQAWSRIRSFVTGYLEEMQLDKQNRFRIPEALAKAARIESEVMIVGQADRLLIKPAALAIEELAGALGNPAALLAQADREELERAR